MRCRKVGQIGENKHFCFQSFLAAIGTEALSIFLLVLSELMLPRGGRQLGKHNSSFPVLSSNFISWVSS